MQTLKLKKKDKSKRIMHLMRQKKPEEKCVLAVNSVQVHMSARGAKCMAGAVQDDGDKEVATQDIDTVRFKFSISIVSDQ